MFVVRSSQTPPFQKMLTTIDTIGSQQQKNEKKCSLSIIMRTFAHRNNKQLWGA